MRIPPPFKSKVQLRSSRDIDIDSNYDSTCVIFKIPTLLSKWGEYLIFSYSSITFSSFTQCEFHLVSKIYKIVLDKVTKHQNVK